MLCLNSLVFQECDLLGCLCITMHELCHWKLCFVSEETAVFTPLMVIRVTVTTKTRICA